MQLLLMLKHILKIFFDINVKLKQLNLSRNQLEQ